MLIYFWRKSSSILIIEQGKGENVFLVHHDAKGNLQIGSFYR